MTTALAGGAPSNISVFAGRIADTGVDPVPVMAQALEIMRAAPSAELIWASPREVLNIVQAADIGCHIITVTLRPARKARLARQGSRALLARDGADVPPGRRGGGLRDRSGDRAVSSDGAVRRALVTGGAGFIGSNLADRLLAGRREVVVYDNFSTGQRRFVEALAAAPGGTLVEGDVLDGERLAEAMRGCDIVFHLAANADVRYGLEHPRPRPPPEHDRHVHGARRDAPLGRAAHRLQLDGLRLRRARRLPHARGLPVPAPDVALRGVEARRRGARAGVLRGLRLQRRDPPLRIDHGRAVHPRSPLRLLSQAARRPLAAGASWATAASASRTSTSTTASTRSCCSSRGTTRRDRSSTTSARTRSRTSTARSRPSAGTGASPPRSRTAAASAAGSGDSPLIHLDCTRLRAQGWQPQLTIAEAVERTLRWFDANPWVFEART